MDGFFDLDKMVNSHHFIFFRNDFCFTERIECNPTPIRGARQKSFFRVFDFFVFWLYPYFYFVNYSRKTWYTNATSSFVG